MKAPDVVIDDVILARKAFGQPLAFTMYMQAWREKNGYRHLHPAIQAAIEDAYSFAHVSRGAAIARYDGPAALPRAFTLNYESRLRVWNSNIAGRRRMIRQFPVVPKTITVKNVD